MCCRCLQPTSTATADASLVLLIAREPSLYRILSYNHKQLSKSTNGGRLRDGECVCETASVRQVWYVNQHARACVCAHHCSSMARRFDEISVSSLFSRAMLSTSAWSLRFATSLIDSLALSNVISLLAACLYSRNCCDSEPAAAFCCAA